MFARFVFITIDGQCRLLSVRRRSADYKQYAAANRTTSCATLHLHNMMILRRDLTIIALMVIATEYVSSHKESGPLQRYCGRNLVNILTMVCDGMYNQMALKTAALAEKSDPSGTDTPLRRKRSVASIFKGEALQRHRRGAYEDCCRKGCTIDEMAGYCGTGPPSS
ncbi:LIRP [Planococcus citri]|uniref:LIRP n=1 Tax=Planococcus citri TaxID=170843 RepID=UPI0031F9A5F3